MFLFGKKNIFYKYIVLRFWRNHACVCT